MDDMQEWADRLANIQEQLGGLYEDIQHLRDELKEAGRKTDATAFNEPLDRLARYGRLFSDMYIAWTDIPD